MGFFEGYTSRFVHNVITIASNQEDIWTEITNVMVTNFKFPFAMKLIGIPKPLSAEVIEEGVGGYRIANFSNNAQFKQEIIEWDKNKRYRFKFNPTNNFRVGHIMNLASGPFEIETGGYDLLDDEGKVKLVLSSNYKLNGFWGALMHIPFRLVVYYFQKYLLDALKKNVESKKLNRALANAHEA